MSNQGFAIVLSGPSGAGKSSLFQRLKEDFPNLLFSISFFAQPSLSTARKTLPLLTTTSYRLIARYPERSVSFWYPVAPNGVAFASVLNCMPFDI